MKKAEKRTALVWAKRLLVYLAGLYCVAMGVAVSAKSDLGVSPVASLANVVYQIGLAQKAPAYVNLGNCAFVVFCGYVLVELLLLRREFRPAMLLQLVASLLYGKLVNLAAAMLAFLPTPGNYGMQLVYLLCSIPLVSFGVMLYLTPDILPNPSEGLTLAISKKSGLSLGSSKVVFDCSVVGLSALTSLAYFHRLVGVREGTVLCALLVGPLMKQMQKRCQAPLLRFVERA
jgi:uncharacterized membrane protein YczE